LSFVVYLENNKVDLDVILKVLTDQRGKTDE
jgi:hypothetical protein